MRHYQIFSSSICSFNLTIRSCMFNKSIVHRNFKTQLQSKTFARSKSRLSSLESSRICSISRIIFVASFGVYARSCGRSDVSIIVDEKIGKAIKKWLKKEKKEQAVQTWVVHVKNGSNFFTRIVIFRDLYCILSLDTLSSAPTPFPPTLPRHQNPSAKST